jgi:pimeloyl-ACP methyl ester carboxylesterase
MQLSATASQTGLFAGQSTQIIGTVANDPSNAGVQWMVSCPAAPCGSMSLQETASGTPTTYIAPLAPPPVNLTVTVTARAQADSSLTATVTITVSASLLTLSLNGGTPVPAGSSTPITATLVHDGASAQVNWSVSCPAAPCGTLSPLTTASGVAATYTAPAAAPPADLGVTLTATSTGNPVLTVPVTITVPAIEVAVSPSALNSVTAGTRAQLTATVSYDPAGKGITWTLKCSAADCGTLAPLASSSGQAVTYQAPATPPPTDLQVTATAQSVSAPSVQASTAITVKAVAVAMTPISALVPLTVAQQFAANVSYDPANSGVNWQLLQAGAPCAGTCGTITPLATSSGAPVTYTAPVSLPAKTAVTLTATSATESSSSVTGTVLLTNGSVQLAPVDMSFFKHRFYGGPAPQQATLTNTGHSPLTFSGITISGSGAAHFSQTTTCGTVVAPGASCAISVTFHWASGTWAAVLSINDSSTDSPQKINLAGNAQASVPALVHRALANQATLVAPRPTGDMTIGTRSLHLIDSRRANPYSGDGSRRELMVRFWYPMAGADAGPCIRADYTAPQTWGYFGALLGVTLPQVLTNSCRDATVAPGPHPVVFLSHGFTGTSSDYTYLAEDLASHGYVVASIDHTNEATAVAFPDGRLVKSVLGSYLTDDWHSAPDTLSLAVAVRLADLRFVLDQLAALNSAPGGALAARLDLLHIAMVGHSLGGLTALRALENEPRIRAAVLLDALVPPHLAAPVRQPVLDLVVGRKWNESDRNLWGALSGERLAVDLPGAEHLALSDAVWLLQGSVATGGTPEAMVGATREYVAAFLDTHLGGKDLRPSLAHIDATSLGAVIVEGSQPMSTQP